MINFPANPKDGDVYLAANGIKYLWVASANFWESGTPASVVGDTGATGPEGPEGATGPDGATGPQGTGIELKGTVPTVLDLDSITSQELGDTWIVEANGNGYTWNGTVWFDIGQLVGPEGPQGATGAQGIQGIQGIDGPKGDGFTNGTYNQSTGIVEFTSDDGLGFTTQDLRGATGPQGIQGIKGDTGNTGPQGIQGVKGNKGDKGDKGDTGNTGPQGATGPQGPTGAPGVPNENANKVIVIEDDDQNLNGGPPLYVVPFVPNIEGTQPLEVRKDTNSMLYDASSNRFIVREDLNRLALSPTYVTLTSPAIPGVETNGVASVIRESNIVLNTIDAPLSTFLIRRFDLAGVAALTVKLTAYTSTFDDFFSETYEAMRYTGGDIYILSPAVPTSFIAPPSPLDSNPVILPQRLGNPNYGFYARWDENDVNALTFGLYAKSGNSNLPVDVWCGVHCEVYLAADPFNDPEVDIPT